MEPTRSTLIQGPETVKKGHHSGLSVVYVCDYNIIITTATIATNCYTTTLFDRFGPLDVRKGPARDHHGFVNDR